MVFNRTSDNKSVDDRAAELDDTKSYHQYVNHKNYNFQEKKNSQVVKERENLH